MKKKLLALTLVLALVLTGCSSVPGNGAKDLAEPNYPKAIKFDDYEGRRDLREKYPVSDEVWDSLNGFAARSTSLSLGNTVENTLYSPISLWFALAICAESAQGETREALLNALGMTGDVGGTAKSVYNRLYSDNEMGSLKLANSLWLNQEFSVKQDFLDRAAEEFYAASYACDFSDPATGTAMGNWLKDATGGLLGGQTIETDPTTLMTLFSALYYSDQWTDRFNKDYNTQDTFHNLNGTTSQAEYMHRTYGSHGWRFGENWLSSSLGLKNGGSMSFVLPDEGVTPGELLSDPTTMAAILAPSAENGGHGEVVFQIPKFTVNGHLDLQDTVTGLGAGAVFDPGADFSALSDEALYLTSVKQEATLSIDEKGVTAAAYTQIDYAGAAPPDGRAELILNRPFLFFVTYGSSVLFIGTVNQM